MCGSSKDSPKQWHTLALKLSNILYVSVGVIVRMTLLCQDHESPAQVLLLMA